MTDVSESPTARVSTEVLPTTRSRSVVGKGLVKGEYRRIVVSFDEDTFRDIYRRARLGGTSFAEQVRILVEHGLELHA